MSFKVNEIFYSLQGEGALSGCAMVFVRFSDCNLRCRRDNYAGFDCDTEFLSGRELTLEELLAEITVAYDIDDPSQRPWILLTGGEPALQITGELLAALKIRGYRIAIETNGTIELPTGIDHVCVSPKSAEHTIRLRHADEVKYVRREGMALPETHIEAKRYVISPAFEADGSLNWRDLTWCIELVKRNPRWSLSLQTHKMIGIR